MNNLQHTAKAALNVLSHARQSLERVASGEGSAMLLPTIADQLADAQKIISMEVEGAKILASCKEAQAEADAAHADLLESLQKHRLSTLADQLEADLAPCPVSRAELLEWLADQIERLKAVGVPDSSSATRMIDAAYLEWINGSH